MKYIIIVLFILTSCAYLDDVSNRDYHLRYHSVLVIKSIENKKMNLVSQAGTELICPIYGNYFQVGDTIDLTHKCKEVAYVHRYMKIQ